MKKNTAQDQPEIAADTPFLHRQLINRLPFRFVIAVPFTLLVLFAVGLTGYVSYRNGQTAVNQLVGDVHKETLAQIDQLLEAYLSDPILIDQLNLDAIHLGTLDVHNQDTLERYFLAQMQRFETVVSVAYANEQREYIGPARKVLGVDVAVGISSAKTGHALEGYEITPGGDRKLISRVPDYDPRSRPWYQAAVQAGRQVWTPIYLWSSGDVGIDAVVPVYSNDNKLLGVLSASLTMGAIGDYLQSQKVTVHGESFIVERSGLLVASSTIHEPFTRTADGPERLSALEVQDPVMKAAVHALGQKVGTLENITDALAYDFGLSGERYFARVVPYRDGYGLDWLIVTVIPESDFVAQINVSNRETGILIGLFLLVSIILAALITLWVTHPIVQLNDSARALASGEWGRRVSVDRTDEIGELAKSFNHMAEQLQASFESIQASEKRYHGLFEDSHISLWEEDGSILKKHLDELCAAGITDWRAYFEEHPEQVRACAAKIKVNDVNRATMTIFGADTKDVFSSGLSPLLTEKSNATIRDGLIALAEGNHYYEADAIHQTNKGMEIIVHFKLSILPGYEDSWSKVLLSLEDITQHKRAEEELRLSEARYRAVVENQTEFIVRWKPDGTRSFANEAYRRYLGLTPEQLASSSFMAGAAEEDRGVVEEKISRLLSGTVTSETDIHRVIKPDGTIGWQEWVDQALYDETGQIVEFQSVGRDITERKHAEDALRESEERFRSLSEAAFEGIMIHDNGIIQNANQAFASLFGYADPKELIGKNGLEILSFTPESREIIKFSIGKGSEEVLEIQVVRPDGSIFPAETRARDITVKGHKLRVVAMWDITKRKKAEQTLRDHAERQTALYNVLRKVSGELDPNVLAQIGVEAVLDMGRWQSVSISLLEANRQEWLTRAEGGPLSGSIFGPHLLSKGIIGRAYRTGQTQLVPDVTTDPDFFTISLTPIKSELATPIRRHEQVIGALNIESDKLSSFTAEDVALAESLADTIGLALASAHLYAEAQLEINERKRAEERLRELTKRLVAAQEEERKRIAQELHDELGQALTAISLDLGSVEKALPREASPEVRERLIEARSLADEVDEQISELALDLRPSLLDDLGLLPTLQWYLNRYSQRLGIEVAVDFKGLESRLPDEIETTLYRVIQEALTNIARHAQASTVRLNLERSAAAVTASIQDDGRGFDVAAQSSAASLDGVGLLGIKDRVSTLGGRVEIHSRPGQGARIHIEIPL